MKDNKKIIITVLVIVCAYLFMLFRPRSFEGIIGQECEKIYDMACSVSIITTYERPNGELIPDIDSYEITADDMDEEELDYILNLLAETKYRPGLMNYSPIPVTRLDSGEDFQGKSITLNMIWGNELDDGAVIRVSDETKIISDRKDGGFAVYHATNKELIHELTAYIQEHGTLIE